MKTVIDAVNEYEAIAPNPCYAENKDQIIMAKKPFDGYLTGDLTTGDGVRDNKYWKVICTREEFNQCVDMLIGDPLKLIKWKESKPSFVKDGATLSKIGPVHKPVYTQAMADKGILPSVGMECRSKENLDYIYIFHGLSVNGLAILECTNNFEIYKLDVKCITCIDTRTDSEKCDDLFKIYLKGENVSTHKSFTQAVKDGDFGDNIKWSK